MPERTAAAVLGPRPVKTHAVHHDAPAPRASSCKVSLQPAEAVRQHADLVRRLAPRWRDCRTADTRPSLLPRARAWRRAWTAWAARIRWHRPGRAARARKAALLALMVPLALAPAGELHTPGAPVLAAQSVVGHAPAGAMAAFVADDASATAGSGFGGAAGWQPAPAGSQGINLAFAASMSGAATESGATADAGVTPASSSAPRRSTARRNAVPSPAPLKWQTAIASFYDWNTWGFGAPGGGRGHTACGVRYTRDLVAVAAPPGMFACGTKIAFRAAGSSKVIMVPVLDSGYFSQLDARRLWDLTSQACQLLRHCYTGTIEWAFPAGS